MPVRRFLIIVTVMIVFLVSLACQALNAAAPSPAPTATLQPTLTPTSLPARPLPPSSRGPDEPVAIIGDIPYTSPFFLNSISEPFVMLEDQAGFVRRDKNFHFSREGQIIGPVVVGEDNQLTYTLALPAVPQGTFVDVDNDDQSDLGVQVFAVAYWSNTWGDPFLEKRDGTGWSNAYASTITDPERDYEITGGILVVWAPDDQQEFPIDFGPDNMLFTADDPVAPIPAGYNLVDLNQKPFFFFKEARPYITLNEGVVAVSDFSQLDYGEAFDRLIEKVAREYPFTPEKQVDWSALQAEFSPRAHQVKDTREFYLLLHEFAQRIPDGHVGLSLNSDIFYEKHGGGFGMTLVQLSDGRLLVTKVWPQSPAAEAGIKAGAEITKWNNLPVKEALAAVVPFLGPYSTEHTYRVQQVNFLTRVPPNTRLTLEYRNPGAGQPVSAALRAQVEYQSFFETIPSFRQDPLALPVTGEVLDESGLGYLRITTFSDDYNLMARLWERYIKTLNDEQVPGLILDLRANSGGSLGLAMSFAGYFTETSVDLYTNYYYNEISGQFEAASGPTRLEPAPDFFPGPLAILVSPDCVSACEGFAYALQKIGRAIVVGHYPTAGAFGEVGQGQYLLPGEMKMQFPTGRPQLPDGQVVIEGTGVIPDILVPITEESALGKVDALLQAAIKALLDQLR